MTLHHRHHLPRNCPSIFRWASTSPFILIFLATISCTTSLAIVAGVAVVIANIFVLS
jgi:hypothetical protein